MRQRFLKCMCVIVLLDLNSIIYFPNLCKMVKFVAKKKISSVLFVSTPSYMLASSFMLKSKENSMLYYDVFFIVGELNSSGLIMLLSPQNGRRGAQEMSSCLNIKLLV